MFRQKRKQRYEVATHVDNLTDGMTARDLTEHLRFWRIMNKWGGPVKGSNEFILAVEKKLNKISKNGFLFILINGFGIFLVNFPSLLPLPPTNITRSVINF